MMHVRHSCSPSAGETFTSNHRLYRHAVQFYLNEEFLLSILCDFTLSALRADDGVVIAVTDAHYRALVQRLGKLGIDVTDLQRQGRFVAMDADEILAHLMEKGRADFSRFQELVGGAIAKVKSASPGHDPHVMVFAEVLALLWARQEVGAMLEVEQFWRILARRLSFSYLGCYSIERFAVPGAEDHFLRICARHSTVIPPDAYPTAEAEKRILEATSRAYAEPARLLPGYRNRIDDSLDLALDTENM
jgi:hypothetical protein